MSTPLMPHVQENIEAYPKLEILRKTTFVIVSVYLAFSSDDLFLLLVYFSVGSLCVTELFELEIDISAHRLEKLVCRRTNLHMLTLIDLCFKLVYPRVS